MKSILFILSTFSTLSLSAQSWQLNGYTFETSFKSPNATVNSFANKVYLTVSDNNGLPVTGLKSSNFSAWGEICNTNRDCDFKSMIIVKPIEGITSFKEQLPGLYLMTFEFESGTISRTSTQRILIQASTWILGAGKKKVTTQHAQVLLLK